MARPRVEEYVIDLLVASSLLLPLLLPFIAADILLLYYYGGRGCLLRHRPGKKFASLSLS